MAVVKIDLAASLLGKEPKAELYRRKISSK
jgi:hypothetical protein